MSKPSIVIVLVAAALVLTAGAFLALRRSSPPHAGAERFRDAVLGYLRAAYPAKAFEAVPGDPQVITIDGFQLGLDNLRRQYELSDKSDAALKELVRNQVSLFTQREGSTLRFPSSLEEARNRLLPQIMSPAIAAGTNNVRIAFAGGLFAGIVADDARAYMYLMGGTLEKWGVSKEEIFEIALKNLDSRSRDLKLQEFKRGDTTFIAVSAGDGYDAARVMLPGLRKVLGARLGFPFSFGVPNRDFLICWSALGGEASRQFVHERLKDDFEHQPHPLSPSVFQMAADGTISRQIRAQPGGSSQ
jgi:hypothetical protein